MVTKNYPINIQYKKAYTHADDNICDSAAQQRLCNLV